MEGATVSRTERLLELLETLRRNRHPVTGAALASALGVSPRSLYRDIASLQSQGARIEGAPGVGYVLRPGFTLPPLMFRQEEIEALVLGARWVAERTDETLAEAARNALAKIAAVLPPEGRRELDENTLLIGPDARVEDGSRHIPSLRKAIRDEVKTALDYRDAKDSPSSRIVWPFALAFFDTVRVVVAWCELRQGFRNFRTDRIAGIRILKTRYPRNRKSLLEEWRVREGIPEF
jgi:predicted DNA-binding transcriptional regulator YafY